MKNERKTRKQLIAQVQELQRQIARLQGSAPAPGQENELEPRVKQLAALTQAAQAVTASLDLDHVLAKVVSLACEVVTADYTGVVLVDERGRLGESAGNLPGVPAIEHRIRRDGCTRWIVDTLQPMIIDEIGQDGAITPHPGDGAPRTANPLLVETGVKSVAGLPMLVKGRLMGVLYLHSLRPCAFEGQRSLLAAFANQAAIAIENARLYEAMERELAERKQAEETLRMVVSSAPIILSALDQEGIYTLSEGRGLDALGVEAGERVGQSVFDVYADRPDILENIRRALAGHVVTATKAMGGAQFEIWYSPRRDGNGKVTGIVGVSTDVTARKRLEEQIRRQERVAAIGQLAGGIAHDFNNFLTSIMLYAQLLLAKPHLPPDLASSIEIILDESRRAAGLVQQILDFSRRSVIETRPVDLVSFIEDAVNILRHTLPENIDVLIDVERGRHVVDADPTRIQQVVMNLALNARDAMPAGGELRISVSRLDLGTGQEPPVAGMTRGRWVCLTFADTGTGIAKEIRPHLFEPFFTTKESTQGAGLGLAQVHGIVEQHGGYVDVESRPQEGTTFRIFMPVYEPAAADEELAEARVVPAGNGETILFVEDEEKVRDAGREILSSLGYRVLTAGDGKEALEIYRTAGEVDLLLTDVVMPKMGGRELVQTLKKDEPDLRTVIVTGYALTEDLEDLTRREAIGVIRKPLDATTLARAIHKALNPNPPA